MDKRPGGKKFSLSVPSHETPQLVSRVYLPFFLTDEDPPIEEAPSSEGLYQSVNSSVPDQKEEHTKRFAVSNVEGGLALRIRRKNQLDHFSFFLFFLSLIQ